MLNGFNNLDNCPLCDKKLIKIESYKNFFKTCGKSMYSKYTNHFSVGESVYNSQHLFEELVIDGIVILFKKDFISITNFSNKNDLLTEDIYLKNSVLNFSHLNTIDKIKQVIQNYQILQ